MFPGVIENEGDVGLNADSKHEYGGVKKEQNNDIALTRIGSLSPATLFASATFNRLYDKMRGSVSGDSLRLSQQWEVGKSRYIKVKMDGITYATLTGRTPFQVPYCFRVRRDEEKRKEYFTPVKLSPAYVMETEELETLPDIVTLEREAFRAEAQKIFEEAKHEVTSVELDKMADGQARGGIEYLHVLRRMHPPVFSPPPLSFSSQGIVVEGGAVECRPEYMEERPHQQPDVHVFSGTNCPANISPCGEVEGILHGTPHPSSMETTQHYQQPVGVPYVLRDDTETEGTRLKKNEPPSPALGIEIDDIQKGLRMLQLNKECILMSNRSLQETVEMLLKERHQLQECVDRLQNEVTQVVGSMDAAKRLCQEEVSRMREEMQAELAAAAEAQRLAISNSEQSVRELRDTLEQYVMRVQEEERQRENKAACLLEAFRASQGHAGTLLSMLEHRERQLAAVLEEAAERERVKSKAHDSKILLDSSSGKSCHETQLNTSVGLHALPPPADAHDTITPGEANVNNDRNNEDGKNHQLRSNMDHDGGAENKTTYPVKVQRARDHYCSRKASCVHASSSFSAFTPRSRCTHQKLSARSLFDSPWHPPQSAPPGHIHGARHHQHSPNRRSSSRRLRSMTKLSATEPRPRRESLVVGHLKQFELCHLAEPSEE